MSSRKLVFSRSLPYPYALGPGLSLVTPKRVKSPSTRVLRNLGGKKRIGAIDKPRFFCVSLSYYGHFFKPPTDVSVFCPGGHLPEPGAVSGLPLPGPSLTANAGAAITSIIATIHRATMNIPNMRFTTVSPPSLGSRSEQFHLALKTAPTSEHHYPRGFTT